MLHATMGASISLEIQLQLLPTTWLVEGHTVGPPSDVQLREFLQVIRLLTPMAPIEVTSPILARWAVMFFVGGNSFTGTLHSSRTFRLAPSAKRSTFSFGSRLTTC